MTTRDKRGLMPSEREFSLFQRLLEQETGIFLAPAKKALLTGRLARRLRALQIESLEEYFHIVQSDADERARMVDCLCTNETSFFREARQLDWVEKELLPRWAREGDSGERPRRIRAWSAACSSGEEPYTLAMLLLSQFPPGSGWDVEVLATDISAGVLARAQAGLWSVARATEIPRRHLVRYMLRGTRDQEGTMQAGPELRSVLRFGYANLSRELPEFIPASFDLILCRNVLIYFGPRTREETVQRLLDRLDPRGCLLLGHAETLSGRPRVQSLGPMAYGLQPRPGSGEAGR